MVRERSRGAPPVRCDAAERGGGGPVRDGHGRGVRRRRSRSKGGARLGAARGGEHHPHDVEAVQLAEQSPTNSTRRIGRAACTTTVSRATSGSRTSTAPEVDASYTRGVCAAEPVASGRRAGPACVAQPAAEPAARGRRRRAAAAPSPPSRHRRARGGRRRGRSRRRSVASRTRFGSQSRAARTRFQMTNEQCAYDLRGEARSRARESNGMRRRLAPRCVPQRTGSLSTRSLRSRRAREQPGSRELRPIALEAVCWMVRRAEHRPTTEPASSVAGSHQISIRSPSRRHRTTTRLAGSPLQRRSGLTSVPTDASAPASARQPASALVPLGNGSPLRRESARVGIRTE